MNQWSLSSAWVSKMLLSEQLLLSIKLIRGIFKSQQQRRQDICSWLVINRVQCWCVINNTYLMAAVLQDMNHLRSLLDPPFFSRKCFTWLITAKCQVHATTRSEECDIGLKDVYLFTKSCRYHLMQLVFRDLTLSESTKIVIWTTKKKKKKSNNYTVKRIFHQKNKIVIFFPASCHSKPV